MAVGQDVRLLPKRGRLPSPPFTPVRNRGCPLSTRSRPLKYGSPKSTVAVTFSWRVALEHVTNYLRSLAVPSQNNLRVRTLSVLLLDLGREPRLAAVDGVEVGTGYVKLGPREDAEPTTRWVGVRKALEALRCDEAGEDIRQVRGRRTDRPDRLARSSGVNQESRRTWHGGARRVLGGPQSRARNDEKNRDD